MTGTLLKRYFNVNSFYVSLIHYLSSLNNLVFCKIKAFCLHVGPAPEKGVASMGVFLRELISYLREFQRKPLETPNNYVDKRDWG